MPVRVDASVQPASPVAPRERADCPVATARLAAALTTASDFHAPGSPAPRPALRWGRAFRGQACQIGEVRQWLTSLLPDCEARSDTLMIAAELGSNAVRHTASGQGSWFAVAVAWHPQVVRLAVADGGGPVEPRVVNESDDEHGRGLLVVRGLSERLGVTGDADGRVVWADIAWPGPPAALAPGQADNEPRP